MIHSVPRPLILGLTSLCLSAHCLLQSSSARRVQVYALHRKIHVQILCPYAVVKYGERYAHLQELARVFEEWVPIYAAHLHELQMSKVHCSTLLTSNVTNNLFLQLHCSNPFSGLWNGNIITFLWCSAFDKTVAC